MNPIQMLFIRVGVRDTAQPHVSPPMGLLCLAAYLRERFDINARIIDQREQNCSVPQLARMTADFGPDIVGISSVSASSYVIPDLTRAISEAFPEALIVLGGPHSSATGEAALEDNQADMSVTGEGELVLEQIVRTWRDTGDYSSIPGLIWRSPDRQIIKNPGTFSFIGDLTTLPLPAYDLIDIRKYWDLHSFVLVPHRKYISIMTSRGCPFQCNYCHKIFGKHFRALPAERVVNEIEYYVKTYGVEDIEFLDDIFNLDYDRAIEVCEMLQAKNLGVKLSFPNGLRTDALSEELIEAMVDAGFYYASFALESGSPRLQKLMGKNLDIPSFLRNVEIATNKGVFGNGFAMMGFPTETREEMQQTTDVMCESRMHTAQFFTVTPFPGTALYEEVARTAPEKLRELDLANSTFGRVRINLSAEPDKVLFACQRKANRRFYMNPSRILRLLRDHPAPQYFPLYVPMFLEKVTKGIFS